MNTAKNLYSKISTSALCSVEERWQRALSFYRKREHVIFVSDRYRYWDNPGFVQQSLAKVLVENGIRVTWLDGMGWKKHTPYNPIESNLLEVKQLSCLPGRRFSWVLDASLRWQTEQIRHLQRQGNPLLWVQGSLDDKICERLDSIDVYSVFDDAFMHSPGSPLCDKTKAVFSQNAYTDNIFRGSYPNKTQVVLPPVELNEQVFHSSSEKIFLPDGFPKKVMGYLGAFFPEGFDFDILHYLVSSLPDWGFLMVGRTDEQGQKRLEGFQKYSNFYHRPWIPRVKLASAWRSLDVNLMLYRPCRGNSGAFPVKVLEALYFGVPSVATRVPKTSSLEGIIPLSSFPDEIKKMAQAEAEQKRDRSRVFESLFYEMHPKVHLAKVAELLG